MVRTITAALLVLALAACTTGTPASGSPSAEQLAPSAPTGEPSPSAPVEPDEHPAAGLALVQFPDPNDPASQIFVVDPDGTLRQVTGQSGGFPGASGPAWSPDRTMIAFNPPKVGAGLEPMFGVVNADGSGERPIDVGVNPRWSPDSTRILYDEPYDGVTGEPTSMFVADVATGEITEIGLGFNGQWIPGDGNRISFNRIEQGRISADPQAYVEVLYTMSLDGGEPEELATDTQAFWSPDGSAVLLAHEGVLSLAQPDGSESREIADGFDPLWSPDGTRILVGYDFGANPIWALLDPEGQAIWSGAEGANPTWSPDGTRLALEMADPEPLVRVFDAATGDVLWEMDGSQPEWAS